MKFGRRSIALRTCLAVVSLLPIADAAAQAPIVIGLATDLSGPFAASGNQMRQGAELAVEAINAGGGVLGRQLKLATLDDSCKPDKAVNIAGQFARDRVPFVVGHGCSGATLAAASEYSSAKIVQITPTSTDPKFTEAAAWNRFRTSGSADQQGKLAGNYLLNNYKGARIAVLDDGSQYGKDMADAVRSTLRSAGVAIAFDQTFKPFEPDHSPLVQKMMSQKPSTIYVGAAARDVGEILKLAKKDARDVTVMGGDVLSKRQFWQGAGSSAAGTLMTASDPRGYKSAADVVKELKKKDIEPEGYVLQSYAAVQIWAAAAAEAGTIDPEKVAASLRSGKEFKSVVGPISFDKKGDRNAPDYSVLLWSGQIVAPSLECAPGCSLDNNGTCVCPSK